VIGPGFGFLVTFSRAWKRVNPGALQMCTFGAVPVDVSGLKLLQLLQFLHFVMEDYFFFFRRSRRSMYLNFVGPHCKCFRALCIYALLATNRRNGFSFRYSKRSWAINGSLMLNVVCAEREKNVLHFQLVRLFMINRF